MKLISRIYDISNGNVPYMISYHAKTEWARSKAYQQRKYYVMNWLCIYGYISAIRDIISDGMCNVNIMQSSPLRFAITYGHEDIVRLLIKYGANVNSQNGDPIRIACEYGFDNIALLLLQNGAIPVNETLCRAAWMGNLECVKLLIEYAGLDPMRNRCRALRYALQRGHFKILDYLRSQITF